MTSIGDLIGYRLASLYGVCQAIAEVLGASENTVWRWNAGGVPAHRHEALRQARRAIAEKMDRRTVEDVIILEARRNGVTHKRIASYLRTSVSNEGAKWVRAMYRQHTYDLIMKELENAP